MNKNTLKKFASEARRSLMQQVSVRIDHVLKADTAELRGKAKQLDELRKQIKDSSKKQVVEKVAYTWFNRLMALRFMDANDYHPVKIVSPLAGHTSPQLLAEAKSGSLPDLPRLNKQKIFDLLDGRIPAKNPQNEVYQLLLVAVCNNYHQLMPFMFEKIADYTELLMPDDLLSSQSIRQAVVDNMSVADCQNEEIIGWLYQFYNADKKDEVFEALKKNVKISADNIPAATQLFTPHWIVRYMVENSLGRLWLQLRPNSRLKERMAYYIPDEHPPYPLQS